jgi:hypothetical protein
MLLHPICLRLAWYYRVGKVKTSLPRKMILLLWPQCYIIPGKAIYYTRQCIMSQSSQEEPFEAVDTRDHHDDQSGTLLICSKDLLSRQRTPNLPGSYSRTHNTLSMHYPRTQPGLLDYYTSGAVTTSGITNLTNGDQDVGMLASRLRPAGSVKSAP